MLEGFLFLLFLLFIWMMWVSIPLILEWSLFLILTLPFRLFLIGLQWLLGGRRK